MDGVGNHICFFHIHAQFFEVTPTTKVIDELREVIIVDIFNDRDDERSVVSIINCCQNLYLQGGTVQPFLPQLRFLPAVR